MNATKTQHLVESGDQGYRIFGAENEAIALARVVEQYKGAGLKAPQLVIVQKFSDKVSRVSVIEA